MNETKMSLRFKVKKCTLSFDFFGVFFLGLFLLQNINQNKKNMEENAWANRGKISSCKTYYRVVNLLKPTKTMDHQLLQLLY